MPPDLGGAFFRFFLSGLVNLFYPPLLWATPPFSCRHWASLTPFDFELFSRYLLTNFRIDTSWVNPHLQVRVSLRCRPLPFVWRVMWLLPAIPFPLSTDMSGRSQPQIIPPSPFGYPLFSPLSYFHSLFFLVSAEVSPSPISKSPTHDIFSLVTISLLSRHHVLSHFEFLLSFCSPSNVCLFPHLFLSNLAGQGLYSFPS